MLIRRVIFSRSLVWVRKAPELGGIHVEAVFLLKDQLLPLIGRLRGAHERSLRRPTTMPSGVGMQTESKARAVSWWNRLIAAASGVSSMSPLK